MVKKVTNVHVIVHRDLDGVTTRVNPPIGKIFDYTDKEVKEITDAKKNGLLEPTTQEEATREELVAGGTAVDGGANASTDPKPVIAIKGNARAAKAAAGGDDI